MSTYTNYTVKARENLSRIRNPGCNDDGISPERVIFSNPNNIYKGTFEGQFNSQYNTFNDCTLNGGIINDAVLGNVMLCCDGQIVKITDLTSNVSEMSVTLDEFLSVTLPEMKEKIAQTATAEGMKQLSILLSDKISSAVSCVLSSMDEISSYLLSNDSSLCSQIDEISGYISSKIDTFIENSRKFHQDAMLSIDSLSNEISSSNARIDEISMSCNGIYEQLNEMSVSISTVSNDLNDYIDKNDNTIVQLCSDLLSNIAYDRHYTIYGKDGEIVKSYPYKVKDFAVNIIEDSAKDIVVTYTDASSSKTYQLGYGYYISTSPSAIHLDLNGMHNVDQQCVPDVITIDLTCNKPVQTGLNNASLTWTGDELVLSASAEQYANVQINGIKIGEVTNLSVVNGQIVSGLLKLLWNDDFTYINGFITNIGQELWFDRDNHSCILSNNYMIQYSKTENSFQFIAGVVETKYFSISDINDNEFGQILSGNANYLDGTLNSLTVTNIALLDVTGCSKNAILDKDNGFSQNISNDIYLSCKVTGNENEPVSVQFDAISAIQYYKYQIKSQSQNGVSCGYVEPDIKNQDLSNGNFTEISLHLDFPISELSTLWEQDYILTGSEGKWSCQHDSNGNSISIEMMIDADNGARLSLSGHADSIGGVSYSANYVVDESTKELDAQRSSFATLASSQNAELAFDKDTVSGDSRLAQCSNIYDGYSIQKRCNVDSMTGPDASIMQVNVPKQISGALYSREFIIAANIKSSLPALDLKLVDPDITEPGLSQLNVFSNGHAGVKVNTNKWTTLQLHEVAPRTFVAYDLENDEISRSIDELSNKISSEIEERTLSDQHFLKIDSILSSSINYLSNDNKEIWKNIRGGLNFKDVLSVAEDVDELSTFLINNFTQIYPGESPSALQSMPIRNGFFYPLVTLDPLGHYNIAGLAVTNGDWLIAKNNFIVSDATSVDMSVFDAQDADVVRVNADNTFTGHNTFTGRVDAYNMSATALSIQLSDIVYDDAGTTVYDLSNEIYSKINANAESISSISNVVSMKSYLGSVDNSEGVQELSGWFSRLNNVANDTLLYKGSYARAGDLAGYLIDGNNTSNFIGLNDYLIINENVILSSIKWQNVNFIRDPKNEAIDISSDLSALSAKVSNDEQSINDLSIDLMSLSARCMHYNGNLHVGDDTSLRYCLEHSYGSNPIMAGSMNRISCEVSLSDDLSNSIVLNENDFIVFNKDIIDFNDATLSDIDVIRDAQTEVETLSNALVSNDNFISSWIQRNFANTGDNNDLTTTIFNYPLSSNEDLSVAKDIYVLNDLSVAKQLFVNNGEFSVDSDKVTAVKLSVEEATISSLAVSSEIALSIQVGMNGFWIDDQPFEYYLSTLEDKVISNDLTLSTAIDRKIFIDGISAETLSAVHISQDDFYQKVQDSQLLSNELYIVSGDYINAYGQQMKNLSSATDLSDAVNLEQLLSVKTALDSNVGALASNLNNCLSVVELDPLSALNESSKVSTIISAVIDIRDALKNMKQVLASMTEQ